MRKLSMVLAGAVAVAGLAFTSGTAGASTVHTESASKCGTKWCGYVNGKKLRVESITVSHKGSTKWSGYIYIEVTTPHHKPYFLWTTKSFKNVKFARADVKRSFPNKTLLCTGVDKQKRNVDHVGDACFTIHK
ncbi:hypothetical protein [Actinoallomurus rhizosphaericola]|uniref:hypothetical protein n=1 Tax=Actinoallomurus rhizosphaericola TaxID=2952536 RepID=UPI002092473E|nr:hypothetical protein [Actinoallomurus rhizosphaericola]MCO5998497.1 hypothetical protein [Actinoallomurus rhizosphaericola]